MISCGPWPSSSRRRNRPDPRPAASQHALPPATPQTGTTPQSAKMRIADDLQTWVGIGLYWLGCRPPGDVAAVKDAHLSEILVDNRLGKRVVRIQIDPGRAGFATLRDSGEKVVRRRGRTKHRQALGKRRHEARHVTDPRCSRQAHPRPIHHTPLKNDGHITRARKVSAHQPAIKPASSILCQVEQHPVGCIADRRDIQSFVGNQVAQFRWGEGLIWNGYAGAANWYSHHHKSRNRFPHRHLCTWHIISSAAAS